MPFNLRAATEHAIHRLHFGYWEPVQFAARKSRRLAVYGIDHLDDLPSAIIDLRASAGTGGCVADCAHLVDVERRYLTKCCFREDDGAAVRTMLWRGVPCVIDLDAYADFAQYLARVQRHSKGAVLRHVRKARAQGFYSKTFFRTLFRRQCFEIEHSKRFRSGPVLASFLGTPPASDFAAGVTLADVAAYAGRPLAELAREMIFPEPPPAPCPDHWATDWGVFIREAATDSSDAGAVRERLVGYLLLRRNGNLVRVFQLMGHGAYLPRHVMKLLFHDVMRWLLAREDPRVKGARYLLYGTIEQGNEGLLEWKRRFEFRPLSFRWPSAASSGGSDND